MQETLFQFIEAHMPLSDEERNAIAGLDLFRTCRKGTFILKQGDPIHESYFVFSGLFRSFYLEEGVERTTDFFAEMEMVTPTTVAEGQPAPVSIVALEDSIYSAGTKEMELRVYQEFPRFERLCRILSEKQGQKDQDALNRSRHNDASERYAYFLQVRSNVANRVPQHMVASYLGIAPESLSRIRKQMAAQGT